jgi:acyl carrier protein phosphodiesterase
MNFLAHIYLSGENDELRFGNFIGDWIKGNKFMNYEGDVRKGILLHRDIDVYTDEHPMVDRSIVRLRPAYGKHSGVAVDILYDHYLAKNWTDFSEIPLKVFVKEFHKYILKHFFLLPNGARRFAFPFIRNRRLMCYADIECFEDVLKKMAIYTSMPDKVSEAMNIIRFHYDVFEQEFRLFFEDAQDYFKNQITNNELRIKE